MQNALFKRFCEIAHDTAGIVLKEGKEALVSTRVAKRVRALGLESEAEYLTYLEQDQSGNELTAFLDVISTNFTSFFRERDHFDLFAESVRRDLGQGRRRLRYWSAASSSGEEPYSMAMLILEELRGSPCDVRILATDISTQILQRAQAGVYPPDRVAPIDKALVAKYFTKQNRPDGPLFVVSDAMKQIVRFKRLNLSVTPFPMPGPLDGIFCRNVMIYLGADVRQALVREAERLLRPDGFFFIGHSESLTGIDTRLRLIRPSVYQKAESTRQ